MAAHETTVQIRCSNEFKAQFYALVQERKGITRNVLEDYRSTLAFLIAFYNRWKEFVPSQEPTARHQHQGAAISQSSSQGDDPTQRPLPLQDPRDMSPERQPTKRIAMTTPPGASSIRGAPGPSGRRPATPSRTQGASQPATTPKRSSLPAPMSSATTPKRTSMPAILPATTSKRTARPIYFPAQDEDEDEPDSVPAGDLLSHSVNHLDNNEQGIRTWQQSVFLPAQGSPTIQATSHPYSKAASDERMKHKPTPRKQLDYERRPPDEEITQEGASVRHSPPQSSARRILDPQFDHSKTPALLSDNYYEKFSEGTQCRLFQPLLADNLTDGQVLQLSRRKQKKPRFVPALSIVESTRIIVDLNQLGKLISPKCYNRRCANLIDFGALPKNTERAGAAVIIRIRCQNPITGEPGPHEKEWYSSRRLQSDSNTHGTFFAINQLLPSAVLLTGNSWGKIESFLKVLGVYTTSRQHFLDMQRYFLLPSITKCWNMTIEMIRDKLREMKARVVVSIDGQADTPGKSASYVTSTAMIAVIQTPTVANPQRNVRAHWKEEPSAYIAAVDILDRRHNNLNSARLEVTGLLRNVMTLLSYRISTSEITTDQHPTVGALFRNAKAADPASKIKFLDTVREYLAHFPDMNDDNQIEVLYSAFKAIDHSLDIWHKARLLRKELDTLKLGPNGDRKDYNRMIDSIVNHFWWSCQQAKGNPMAMKDAWLSMLHHIRGEHEWDNGGKCAQWDSRRNVCGSTEDRSDSYRFLTDIRPRDEILDDKMTRDEKIFYHVQKVATNQAKFLQYFPQLANFRHTGELESYHALTLKYALKRLYFAFIGYICRKLLAALDWNNSVRRPMATYKDGTPIHKIRYSRRPNDTVEMVVKVEKNYCYLLHLLAYMLHMRTFGPTKEQLKERPATTLVNNDPRNISQTIAPPEARKSHTQTLQAPRSRFSTILRVVEKDKPNVDEEEPLFDVDDAPSDDEIELEEDYDDFSDDSQEY